MHSLLVAFFIFLLPFFALIGKVQLGVENLFHVGYEHLLPGQHIGLITNHTGIDSRGDSTVQIFKDNASRYGYVLEAVFAPEHGLTGSHYANVDVADGQLGSVKDKDNTVVYSLFGATRRPTAAMLKNITLLIYDIQDIGSRSYTYVTTLFYVMEEAAKARIPVLVLDRPNPLGGTLVDGPMLEEKWRSFVGYINVPYCHGLTVGELAQYFNGEYSIGCALTVVPMKGWKREMLFADTGLVWMPTSPHIPEASSALYYPMTGFLGELQLINMGVGYTLPFKVVGAPWINAEEFSQKLNEQQMRGVRFLPFHYKPFFGRFQGQECHGVLIVINEPKYFLPVSTQYVILGMLKSLYPKHFKEALQACAKNHEMFNKVNGTAEVYRLISEEKYVVWKLLALHKEQRAAYLCKRKPYLLY